VTASGCNCSILHILGRCGSDTFEIVETKNERVPMNVAWIIVGVGIVGFLAKRIAWSGTRDGQSDLGFVSQQWLAEHRLSQISDPQR
jgi:hypothetical protein